VASYDSSGSESRGGLNRYYKQAWENLQEGGNAPGNKGKHPQLKRKETLDEPGFRGGARDAVRDASEIVVDNKRRHHHHHHHHPDGNDWRQGGGSRQPKSRY
jgi:hypothetical protein